MKTTKVQALAMPANAGRSVLDRFTTTVPSRPARPPAGAPVGVHELVIVANRLPVSERPDGSWTPSPGGLVSALLPVARRHRGAWVGWSGRCDTFHPELDLDQVVGCPVPLASREQDAYYSGYANAGLWPLLHDGIRPSRREPSWWPAFTKVNARFARRAAMVAGPGARVLVQDYHLMLVPAMLRKLRPDLRIGFFLHTPFPAADIFARFPDAGALLAGLFGADVIGVQTKRDRRHLIEAASGWNHHSAADPLRGGETLVEAFPISVDTSAIEALAASATTTARSEALRRDLGSPRHLLLGVDRLDYTKGIEERLQAFRALLRKGVLDPADATLVQVCVPSREAVTEYQRTRRSVEALVSEINDEFGGPGRTPVHYRFDSLAIDELVAHYRAADVMLVTPIRDGMNLVAKEYVASRTDGTGALVLSTGAGAAHELTAAHLVDPGDHGSVASGIALAVREPDRGAGRMAQLRAVVRSRDVHRWAADLVRALP